LNILPAEVAEELKETGTTKAQHFDHVTVLFTDFVNFTQISEQLSPEQLVQELHECFRVFDDIMERNGLEKIKTIGDAYLAVSGMPAANERHAYSAVKAGLEIIDFIKSRSSDKHSFEVRVGINSGELVAGIVGVKKFAYDIWGDTVNMASRMESNSESGRVNISENTHALVLNDFTFTYRGKINAKNKGAVDMYFVDAEIKKP
jgi:class 3 adenylate cyclase